MVNPQIAKKFKSEQDLIEGKVYDEYESWTAQDQTVFIWLLSTISDFVLPRVLSCKDVFEVWD